MKGFLLYAGLGIAAISLMNSCATDEYDPAGNSSDLWKGELASAPYENDAVCLQLEEAVMNDKSVSTIELTGSGDYFITYVSYEESDWNYKPSLLRKAKGNCTRELESVYKIQTGEFNKLGDSKFSLEGFGVITINPNGTVTVDLEDGKDYLWAFTKADKIADTALNSRLCRTWKLQKVYVEFLDKNRKVIYTLNVPDQEMRDEYIYSIAFTLAGRYYTQDEAYGAWYGGIWEWSNVASQIISTVPDDEDEEDGTFQVLFDNNRMDVMIPTVYEDADDARDEFWNITGSSNIPEGTRYGRQYIKMVAREL